MLRIDITPLKTGVHHVDLESTAEDLDLDPAKFRDIRVEARLDVYERRILVVLRARATAELTCDRTLRDFDQEISGSYHVLFAPAEMAERDEEESGYDDIRPLDPNDLEIDLTTPVRDTLMLAVPQRCVAPGAEDEEIPTAFGTPADGIDPRWDALRKLRDAGSDE